MAWWLIVLIAAAVLLVGVTIFDLVQTRDPIWRNFPIVGHFRAVMTSSGPKLRQYIVAANDEERPFSRDQRRWVADRADDKGGYFGFGTDNQIDADNYLIVKHSAFPDVSPIGENAPLPCAKVIGGWRDRTNKFRPDSLVYVSAMSYGSLSARAVEAINRGCGLSDTLHNTGEGGIAEPHRHGGPVIFQFGTGYFGCRNPDGSFSLDALVESAATADVRCIEVKLSQGAKPGLGGVLPGKKVTPTIAAARGGRGWRDRVQPQPPHRVRRHRRAHRPCRADCRCDRCSRWNQIGRWPRTILGRSRGADAQPPRRPRLHRDRWR